MSVLLTRLIAWNIVYGSTSWLGCFGYEERIQRERQADTSKSFFGAASFGVFSE